MFKFKFTFRNCFSARINSSDKAEVAHCVLKEKLDGSGMLNEAAQVQLSPHQMHIDVMVGCGTLTPAKILDHAIVLQCPPGFLVMIGHRGTSCRSQQAVRIHTVEYEPAGNALF